jgi:GntR family transcriptional regulator / MocR family aminotransferase
MQRIYRARRDAMAALLARELGGAVTVTPPVGGTAFWLRVAPDIDIDRWSRMAAAQEVIFEAGDRFSFDGAPLPYIRVGFAGHREPELAEAVRRMAAALALARRPKTAAS